MEKPHIKEMYNKEFIIAMQAKGKLDKIPTAASEKREEAYFETTDRIFPGLGGKNAYLQTMLANASNNIDATLKVKRSGVKQEDLKRRTAREELKTRISDLQANLEMEREARIAAEQQLQEIRKTH